MESSFSYAFQLVATCNIIFASYINKKRKEYKSGLVKGLLNKKKTILIIKNGLKAKQNIDYYKNILRERI